MKIFRAVERGIEIPENLDDLVIPEKTEQKPEMDNQPENQTKEQMKDQKKTSDPEAKQNTVTLDKPEIQ